MESSYELVKSLYKNDLGQPFEMTPSQVELFDAIFYGIVNVYEPMESVATRVQGETYTQFGKSEIASMAVLTAVSTYPIKVAIIAPTTNKAKIIMGYIIKHIFDNNYTIEKFDVGKEESLEHIRRERSKNRLTFRIPNEKGKVEIGEVYILSAEAKRKGEDAGNALMGFGAPAILEDESALIPDPIHSKGLRMVGGHKRNFVCKLGNPFKRNHFLRTHNSPKYKKIIVDCNKGIEENRLTQEFVEEMRKELFFDILYEVKFPDSDKMDDQGWVPLLADSQIETAMIKSGEVNVFGIRRIGFDPAGGGQNYSVGVMRGTNYAKCWHKSHNGNQMDLAAIVSKGVREYVIKDEDIFIDKNGVGKGLFDILKEHRAQIPDCSGAHKPNDEDLFVNARAEWYWRLRNWILAGGRLEENEDWFQLTKIKYKSKFANNKAKMIIMSKEEMLREGIESPDVADALALTFARPDTARKQGTIQEQIRSMAQHRRNPPSWK